MASFIYTEETVRETTDDFNRVRVRVQLGKKREGTKVSTNEMENGDERGDKIRRDPRSKLIDHPQGQVFYD